MGRGAKPVEAPAPPSTPPPQTTRKKKEPEPEPVVAMPEPPNTDDAHPADFTPAQRGLTTIEAAQRLGMSVPWVKLHAHELGGRLTRRGYRFPTEVTFERTTEKVTMRPHTKAAQVVAKEDREGDFTRRAFPLLDGGMTTRALAVELGITGEKARQLSAEWIKCGQYDENVLAVVHGRREPARPAPSPQGYVPQPMQPMSGGNTESPAPTAAPSPMPALAIPATPYMPIPEPAGRLGLAETMRRNAQAQIAAGDAKLDELKRRMQTEGG